MATDTFSFTVNATEIKTQHEKLIAADILKLAEQAGAIPIHRKHIFLKPPTKTLASRTKTG